MTRGARGISPCREQCPWRDAAGYETLTSLPAAQGSFISKRLFWKGEEAGYRCAVSLIGTWQPEEERGGLSSFHSRKTRDCSTRKNSPNAANTRSQTHTSHPWDQASMFRPSAVRDTRERGAVKISRGSLVLVDSTRKKTTSSDSVVAQLHEIYLIVSVWQLQEGETKLCVP